MKTFVFKCTDKENFHLCTFAQCLLAMRALLGSSDEAVIKVMRYCTDEALDIVCATSLDSLIGVLWVILVDGRE